MPVVRLVPAQRTFGSMMSFRPFYRNINKVYKKYKRPFRRAARSFSKKNSYFRPYYRRYSRARRFYKRLW